MSKIVQPPPEEMALLKADFQEIDSDQDGFISVGELQQMLKEQNQEYSEEEVALMISTVDADNDQRLSLKEFVVLMSKYM